MNTRGGIVLLAILLACSILASPVQAGSNGSADCIHANGAASVTHPDLYAQVTAEPGKRDVVNISYAAGAYPGRFTTDLNSSMEVVEFRGFTHDEQRNELTYTGKVDDPYIVYKVGGPRGPVHFEGGDGWVFSKIPTHTGASVKLEASPAGVIGDKAMYVGNYTRYTTSAGCQEISLIVSDASDPLHSDPNELLDALRYASAEYRVGHRYSETRLFVTPGTRSLKHAGWADGNDAWVSSVNSKRIGSTSEHAYIHEYIHTRQVLDGSGFGETIWLTEGITDYYSWQVMLDQELVTPREYNDWLERGSTMDAALDNSSTYPSRRVKYDRGGAYVAILDYRIKQASNDTHSFEDLVRQMNSEGQEQRGYLIQKSVFLDRVENISDKETRQWANHSMSTTDVFNYEPAQADTTDFTRQDQLRHDIIEYTEKSPSDALLYTFLFGFIVAIIFISIADWAGNRWGD